MGTDGGLHPAPTNPGMPTAEPGSAAERRGGEAGGVASVGERIAPAAAQMEQPATGTNGGLQSPPATPGMSAAKPENSPGGATPTQAAGEMPGSASRACELTEKQLEALALLTSGHNITQVAERTGVNRSTIHRWLKDPQFAAERDRAFEEKYKRLHAGAMELSEEALKTVKKILEDSWSERERLAAARIVFSLAGLYPRNSRS